MAALVQPFGPWRDGGGWNGTFRVGSICSRGGWIKCQWKEWGKRVTFRNDSKPMHWNSSQILTFLWCFYFVNPLVQLGPNWRGTLSKKQTNKKTYTCIVLSPFKSIHSGPSGTYRRAARRPLLLAVVPPWCAFWVKLIFGFTAMVRISIPRSPRIPTRPPPPASLSAEISSTGLHEPRTFYPNCCRRIGDETTFWAAIKSYLSVNSDVLRSLECLLINWKTLEHGADVVPWQRALYQCVVCVSGCMLARVFVYMQVEPRDKNVSRVLSVHFFFFLNKIPHRH